MLFVLALALAPSACSDDSAAADAAVTDSAAADQRVADGSAADLPRDALVADISADLGGGDGPASDGPAIDSVVTADTLTDSLAPPDLPTSGCNASKIDFTQVNPNKYELFEFCFPSGDTVTMAQAKALDPGLNCAMSGGGIVAKCPSNRWRCMGTLVKDPSGAIQQASWDKVCLLSQLPNIGQIKGGYFI